MKEYANPTDELPLFRHKRRDHATSVAAAKSLPSVTTNHSLLLSAYRAAGAAGLTDEEAARASGVDLLSCWTKRCGELRTMGLIAPTGETRISARGRARIVCAAVHREEDGCCSR